MEGLATGEIYHVFNRGVDHRSTFEDDKDRERFLRVLEHHRIWKALAYSQLKRRPKRFIPERELRAVPFVQILCYCLMPNHFHLLLRQFVEHGISRFTQRFLNSYTRYYNTRHNRNGPLFSGTVRAVHIGNDEQFLHVTRYIHLNPVVARVTDDPFRYPWSSAPAYSAAPFVPQNEKGHPVVELSTELLASMIPGTPYERFVRDHIGYARTLENIKHVLLDEEETLPVRARARVHQLL